MNKNDFLNEWRHFCKTINFNASFLDAQSIRFMNEFTSNLDLMIKEEGSKQ